MPSLLDQFLLEVGTLFAEQLLTATDLVKGNKELILANFGIL